MPATTSKTSQLDYGAFQAKNDTHCNAKGCNETHRPQRLLVPFLREFRVRNEAFLCPSEWLCEGEGAGIAELTPWCVQSGWLEEGSGTWAGKVKLLSSVSDPLYPPWLLLLCLLASLER